MARTVPAVVRKAAVELDSRVGAAALAVTVVGVSLARDSLARYAPLAAVDVEVAGYVLLGAVAIIACLAFNIPRQELGLGRVDLRTRTAGCLVLCAVFAAPLIGRRLVEPHASAVLLALLAAPIEELVCRGALFALLRRTSSGAIAAIVTALIFAAMHAAVYSWPTLAVAALAGLVFGAWRAMTGDLLAPIAGHLVADMAAAVAI